MVEMPAVQTNPIIQMARHANFGHTSSSTHGVGSCNLGAKRRRIRSAGRLLKGILMHQFPTSFAGDLHLSGRMFIKELPAGMTVGRNLVLDRCLGLAALPDGLSVGRHLVLVGCKDIGSLPANLKVAGDLYLQDCENINALPDDLQVGGRIIRK
jgi:hypothetical protein